MAQRLTTATTEETEQDLKNPPDDEALDELDDDDEDYPESDGQPDEHQEWQDLPWGGDDDPIYSEPGFFDE